jgi:hypothetical protein
LQNAALQMTLLKRAVAVIVVVALVGVLGVETVLFFRLNNIGQPVPLQLTRTISQAAGEKHDILFLGFDILRYADFLTIDVWQQHRYPVALPVSFELSAQNADETMIAIENLRTSRVIEYYQTVRDEILLNAPQVIVISNEQDCYSYCQNNDSITLLALLQSDEIIYTLLTTNYMPVGEFSEHIVFKRINPNP